MLTTIISSVIFFLCWAITVELFYHLFIRICYDIISTTVSINHNCLSLSMCHVRSFLVIWLWVHSNFIWSSFNLMHETPRDPSLIPLLVLLMLQFACIFFPFSFQEQPIRGMILPIGFLDPIPYFCIFLPILIVPVYMVLNTNNSVQIFVLNARITGAKTQCLFLERAIMWRPAALYSLHLQARMFSSCSHAWMGLVGTESLTVVNAVDIRWRPIIFIISTHWWSKREPQLIFCLILVCSQKFCGQWNIVLCITR